MNPNPAPRWSSIALVFLMAIAPPGRADSASAREGMVDQGRSDPRLKGVYVPDGFKARVVASEPALSAPVVMAFDDLGSLYVAEWAPSDRAFETWDAMALPEGGSARVRRRRKGTTDVVKRLKDADGDGVYESSEVAVEGAEMPSGILPWKGALLLTCVGRLERWSDEDGDGRFETKAVLADGFSADGRHGLSGVTPGPDGWLYLTTGDGDNRVVGSDGSRVDLPATGGVLRCRFDGSKLTLFALGLRNPRGPLAFDSAFSPFLIDDDGDDGSKFQGCRLVAPVEGGDYGWRRRPGSPPGTPDFDRSAAEGDRPGKLAAIARIGRGSPAGVVVYEASALPEVCRGLIFQAEPRRRTVRGFRVESQGGSPTLKGETTLMVAHDDRFRPSQAVVGADGALYVLDGRSDGKSGRVYRLTREGEGVAPNPPAKANHWKRIFDSNNKKLLFETIKSADFAEADRAVREAIDRDPTDVRRTFLAWAGNAAASTHARLLGIQGARRLWNDEVEAGMLGLLGDPLPEVRRLALQALSWEPKSTLARIVPKLIEKLDDPDARVAREAALALGRHSEGRPRQAAAVLLRWLQAHPKADPAVRDGFLRGLERLGDAGVEEVALAVRTRRAEERSAAVALFTGFRSAEAGDQLGGLVKMPDLSTADRVALIRMFNDLPAEVAPPTIGLAEFIARGAEVEPAVKVAALDACRLAGNPASALVLALLDDDDESVRSAATRAAARSRPPGSVAILARRLGEDGRSPAERLASVRALRGAGPSAFAAVEAAYLASDDPAFRLSALRTLADLDRVRATPALESTLAGPSPDLRALAVAILGDSPKSALMLGKAILNRTLPRSDLPAVVAALRKFEGPEPRRQLAAIEAESVRGITAIDPGEVAERAEGAADPWAGLGVFFRESGGRCSSCHRVGGMGGKAGPPLDVASHGLTAARLVDSILTPSRSIKERHETTRFDLIDGGSVRGVVAVRDDRSFTILGDYGEEIRVARDEIDAESKDPASLMPSNLALDLSPADLADLVAFLLDPPAQASLRHGPRRLDHALAIGPMATGADKLRVPLDRVDPARPLAGQDGRPISWASLHANDAGVFDLRGQFGSGPGRAYLAVQVRSPRDQAAALRFAVEGGARVYLNGVKVADVADREDPLPPPTFARPGAGALAPLPGLAALPLKGGWNLVVVALDRWSGGDAHAAFEVASPEPIEVRAPTKSSNPNM